MRPLMCVLLVCAFACASPRHVEALSCAVAFFWQSFERTDGDADLETRRRDAERRASLANLERTPIVFRGRFAWARDLSDRRKTSEPLFLIGFKDIEVLRGEIPRSAHDRKALVVYYAWCDTRCGPASRWWPRGPVTVGVHPFGGGAVREGMIGTKVVYRGRVDAVAGPCTPKQLTPLQEELLTAPAGEIARLKREYPPHPIRTNPPPGSN